MWCTGFTPAEAAPVLRDFGGRWKASIEAMHKEVLGQVADAACAREVLQVRMCPADCCLPAAATRG
jgi:hypothetical protein